jgi:L-ribulose-5-phosphate 4-epimerase
MPAVLVAGHAPFCWGKSVSDAAHNAVVLEEVAHMALQTVAINSAAQPISQAMLDKHFLRKHGSGAYYGQK